MRKRKVRRVSARFGTALQNSWLRMNTNQGWSCFALFHTDHFYLCPCDNEMLSAGAIGHSEGQHFEPSRQAFTVVRYVPHRRGLESPDEEDPVQSRAHGICPAGPPCRGGLPRLPRKPEVREHAEQVPGLPRRSAPEEEWRGVRVVPHHER